MHRLFQILVVALWVASAVPRAAGEDAPAPAAAPMPRGLYALVPWGEAPAGTTWRNPDADGVVIRTYWRDVNPAAGTFTWDFLDAQFDAARTAGKRIHLEIAPGFYSPDWVLHREGVKTADFTVPQGPFKGERRPLPLPWDDAYLGLWLDFVDAAARRHAPRAELGWISLTGPNSHNGEVSLPREEPQDEARWLELAGGADRAERVRNLKARLTGAWTRTIDRFAAAFKGRRVTLALIHRSLPVEGEADLEWDYKAGLVRYGVERHADVFGLQTNGLDGRPVFPKDKAAERHWKFVEDNAGKVLTGFQTRAPGNLYPERRRAGGEDKARIFRQAVLENGVARRASFVEIYESDLADPALAATVHEAHAALVK